MKAFTYIKKGEFAFVEKAKPTIKDAKDAIVRVTMSSICTSDLHIKHGSVPRAVPGITVGHEMVGVVEEVGGQVTHVKLGDRVTVNGDLLWRMLLLPAWIRKQLYFSSWWLGVGVQDRWWADGIRQSSVCHYRIE